MIHRVIIFTHRAAQAARLAIKIAKSLPRRALVTVPVVLAYAAPDDALVLDLLCLPTADHLSMAEQCLLLTILTFLRAFRWQPLTKHQAAISWIELFMHFEIHGLTLTTKEDTLHEVSLAMPQASSPRLLTHV